MDEESHEFGLITRRRVEHSTRRCCGNDSSCIPHPSLALIKFWQGRMEVILRLLCMAFSGSALIAGVVFNSSLGFPNTNEEAKEVIETNRSDAHKVVLWVMSAAAVGFIIQFLVIVGRFLNFEFVRSFSSLVHVLDIISNVIFTSAYFTLIIPLAVFYRNLSQLQKIVPLDNVPVGSLRTKCSIVAGMCSTAMVMFFLLSVWMSLYLTFDWHKELVKHITYQPPSRQTTPLAPPEEE